MAETSNIAWTDASWNPVTGCSRVSEACRSCYAEELSLRYGWTKLPWTAGNAVENVVCHPKRLELPLKWKEGRKIFLASMGDVFHANVPFEFIAAIFAVMAATPRHTYQLLTKRPGRMAEFFAWVREQSRGYLHGIHGFLFDQLEKQIGADRMNAAWDGLVAHREARRVAEGKPTDPRSLGDATAWPWPLPNVWLGTTTEDQKNADARIPHLLRVPAVVRFLSVEPMLGPVRLWAPEIGEWPTEEPKYPIANAQEWDDWKYWTARDRGLHWVIVGGESGLSPRPLQMAWARALRDQCVAAGVAYFFKQDSSRLPGQRPYLVEADGSCFEWRQFPGALTPPIPVSPKSSDPRPKKEAATAAKKKQLEL
jgi:protein gp37